MVLKGELMHKINTVIKNAIRYNMPLCFGKLGGIEASHVFNYLRTNQPRLLGNTLFVNAGIYGHSEAEIKAWCDHYIEAVQNLDYVLQWCSSQGDEAVIDMVWKGKEIFHEFEGLEPFVHGENGWHYSLSNKKVLFISPFSDTVKSQAPDYNKIWKGAKIGEVLTVTSPYSEALTGEKPVSWYTKFRTMIDKIVTLDFDFASVGGGGFALPVCHFIKTVMHRPCVHLGGGNQLLFGIIGKRWENNETLSKFFNKHWTRPLDHEIPKNHTLVEEGCYW